jgi:hypothetical protein
MTVLHLISPHDLLPFLHNCAIVLQNYPTQKSFRMKCAIVGGGGGGGGGEGSSMSAGMVRNCVVECDTVVGMKTAILFGVLIITPIQ